MLKKKILNAFFMLFQCTVDQGQLHIYILIFQKKNPTYRIPTLRLFGTLEYIFTVLCTRVPPKT